MMVLKSSEPNGFPILIQQGGRIVHTENFIFNVGYFLFDMTFAGLSPPEKKTLSINDSTSEGIRRRVHCRPRPGIDHAIVAILIVKPGYRT